jgi:hypothetical protein
MLPHCVNLKVTMQRLASFSEGLYFNSAWRLVILRGFPDLPQFIQENSRTIHSFFNLWLISILYSSSDASHRKQDTNWFCVNNQGKRWVDSKRFWWWCIILRLTGLLNFVHHRYSRNQKTKRFEYWICFCPQVRRADTYSVGSLRES